MTTKQLERKASELESLITDHRVVRIQYTEAEHFTVKVNRDMPEWCVKAGEIVHLYKSSYEGYYYIVRWDSVWTRHACSCRGYEMRHHCRHADAVNEICKSRYHQRKATPARVQETWDELDTPAHVADDQRGDGRTERKLVKAELNGRGFKMQHSPELGRTVLMR